MLFVLILGDLDSFSLENPAVRATGTRPNIDTGGGGRGNPDNIDTGGRGSRARTVGEKKHAQTLFCRFLLFLAPGFLDTPMQGRGNGWFYRPLAGAVETHLALP